MERLGHALMEKWSEGHLQHPAPIHAAITFATLTGKNYLGEGKRSWVMQVRCLSALEQRRCFALGCQKDSVWTFQQFGLQSDRVIQSV